MDRNSVIGLLLIATILIGYSWYTRPSAEEAAKMRYERDSVEALKDKQSQAQQASQSTSGVTSGNAPSKADSIAIVEKKNNAGSFAAAIEGKQSFYILENELIKVTLSNKGGRIYSVQLKEHKRFDGTPTILFDGDSSQMGLHLFAQNRPLKTQDLYFIPVIKDKTGKQIAMRLYAGDSTKYIEYLYSIEPNNHALGFKISLVGLSNTIAQNSSIVDLVWETSLNRQEMSFETERQSSTIFYKFLNDEVDELSSTSDEEKSLPNKVKWVSFKQQYFTSVLIADNGFEKPTNISVTTDVASQNKVKTYKAAFAIPYGHSNSETFAMQFYFGPNHYKTLKSYELDLEKQIPLGWGIFGWINKGIVIPVFNWLKDFGLNFGLIIFILTILMKLLLTPLTYSSYISQTKMKILKPEMDEIDKKNDGDAMKSQQDKMALFKKAGVNPFGGCFPMLLQLPILIALVSFFPSSVELRQQGFLWAKDLSTYDSVLDFGFNIPFYGDHLSLFALLMTITTLILTWQNSQITTAQNPQMKWMMYLMPIVFLFFLNSRSAALSYYYLVANIITMAQQVLMRRMVDENALHAKIQENKKKPQSTKKSAFQKRLEEMAKQRGYTPKK